MEIVKILRSETSKQGTFGRLFYPKFTCFTGELQWLKNAPNVSCIPEWVYNGVWTYSNRFKRCMYSIIPVSGRDGIRIHSANFVGTKSEGLLCQLNGCVTLGEKLGYMNNQKAVLLSAPAVRKFESIMNKKPFILEVKNGWYI